LTTKALAALSDLLNPAYAPHSPPMARYKIIDADPKLLAVDPGRQLLVGTIEHAVRAVRGTQLYCDGPSGRIFGRASRHMVLHQ
jgi:hypothetical protein